MVHHFIINPTAGRQDASPRLQKEIAQACRGLDWDVHITKYPGHATQIARALAEASAPEPCRLYACGGDGTLSEVANGAAGMENAQVACVPCGTGNDFIKMFGGQDCFRDLAAQAAGEVMPVDLIAWDGRRALNICNAGIDARVAHWVLHNKRRVPLGGSFPYTVALVVNFFSRINRFYRVEVDGEPMDGEYAILVAANGRYYGGGYYAVPEAQPDDGLLDFVCITRVSRLTLLRCVALYAAGRHAELPDSIHRHIRGRELTLMSDTPEPFCADGEITVTDRVTLRAAPAALRFVVPRGAALLRPAKIGTLSV